MWAKLSQYAALPLRLGLGGVFIVYGAQRLFGLFGGPGLGTSAERLEALGFAPGLLWAVGIGLAELVGGVALLLGLLTRWVALVLAVKTLAAALVGYGTAATAVPGAAELPLILLAGLLSLGCSGAQTWALEERWPALAKLGGSAETRAEASRSTA
jgi:putative oxidoreductase